MAFDCRTSFLAWLSSSSDDLHLSLPQQQNPPKPQQLTGEPLVLSVAPLGFAPLCRSRLLALLSLGSLQLDCRDRFQVPKSRKGKLGNPQNLRKLNWMFQ